jgi:hypothetical protein
VQRLGDVDAGIAPRLFIHRRCGRLLETLPRCSMIRIAACLDTRRCYIQPTGPSDVMKREDMRFAKDVDLLGTRFHRIRHKAAVIDDGNN